MPMYEYKCHSCGKVFEVRQSFSDAPLTRHEECGGNVERLLSAPALQFKGSGWYITDYAKGSGSSKTSSGSNAAKSDSGKSESSASSSESKSSGSSTTSSSDSK